ncbi:cytochrome c oxidase accessory protein CcoG [Curvibacter sp. APW13]|nr:cytochrome c oxidase accessory protein CcoG [Curvibacter sp. APW13]MDT8990259.1 cytochrome c oxidase accessory protein CcoG [Curvibacter sp. APW13]
MPIQAEPSGSAPPQFDPGRKLYPRSVQGLFARWRWGMVFLTQLVFYGVPWLQWGERQAVLFDLETRRFFLFGLVLYPQDLIYLTGLLVISALALFLFTAVAGRLWCGYSCPQTVYSEIFMWIERKTEGDRAARMRLDSGPWNLNKVWRKSAKQFLWVAVAFWTGFTFVGYFTPIQVLAREFIATNLGPWETFWVFFYGFATYGNAGFLRERICIHMCPYARFQSAMFDRDTLIVTYDQERGEPRGARSKKADPAKLELGDCVDCTLCVQVCPTGIDIRNGLQYQCIGCGACIDVCDTVMDKVGYSKGLIRYSTENAIEHHWSSREVLAHVMRPRVLVYSGIILAITLAMLLSLSLRTPFKVDVVRDRGVMARIAEGGLYENVYRIQIMNASEKTQHYTLTASGIPGLRVNPATPIEVKPAESRWVVVQLQASPDATPPGTTKVVIDVALDGTEHKVTEKTVFMAPR